MVISTKLRNIGFPMEHFVRDFLQFWRTTVKICLFGSRIFFPINSKDLTDILLKFFDFLKWNAACDATCAFRVFLKTFSLVLKSFKKYANLKNNTFFVKKPKTLPKYYLISIGTFLVPTSYLTLMCKIALFEIIATRKEIV